MTKAVSSAKNMEVGGKGKGRHWTKKEIEARQAAEAKLERKSVIKLNPPDWLKENEKVFAVWKRLVKEAEAIELLDNIDSDVLATYCKLEIEKEVAMARNDLKGFKELARLCLIYAKSLGFTPEARARLAKKRADEEIDENKDFFD